MAVLFEADPVAAAAFSVLVLATLVSGCIAVWVGVDEALADYRARWHSRSIGAAYGFRL